MANYLRAAGYSAPYSAGVGCCACLPRTLAGYVSTTLRGYRVTLAGLGDPVIPPGTPAMLPVSDKRAVAAAIRLFQMARSSGMSDAAQAQSAASMAATGAKVGSIIPGIGTVIGAVVGAVVGWIAGKKKPVRPSAAQVQECKALVGEYMSYAAQSPDAPLPLEREQLLNLHWCLQALYGGKYIGVKDPRWFNPGVEAALFPAAQQLVKKIFETPVGQNVAIDEIAFKDPKGRTLKFAGFSFVNPVFTNLKTFTDQVWLPMAIQYCQNTAGKGAPGCPEYYQTPEFRRWLYDLIAWAARTQLPNISEQDLAAASTVAAQTGSASSDVVKAVEQIIGRTVQRGETSALLTNTTAPPPATAPPIATAQPVMIAPPPAVSQPLPAPVDVPPQTYVQPQVPRIMPAPVDQVVKPAIVPTQAGTGSQTPLLLGAAALLFALAYPRRSSRGSKVTS